MQTLDDLMGDYEAELLRAADARDLRVVTPGTVEYAQAQRANAKREREAALLADYDYDAPSEDDEDEDEDGDDYDAEHAE